MMRAVLSFGFGYLLLAASGAAYAWGDVPIWRIKIEISSENIHRLGTEPPPSRLIAESHPSLAI